MGSLTKWNPTGLTQFSGRQMQEASVYVMKQVRRFGQVANVTQADGQAKGQGKGARSSQKSMAVQGFEETSIAIFQQSFRSEVNFQQLSQGAQMPNLLQAFNPQKLLDK